MEDRDRAGWQQLMAFTQLLARLGCATVIAALGVAGCGGDDSGGSDEGSAAKALPPGAVSIVGDAEVTKDDLAKQVAVIRRSLPEGQDFAPTQIRQQALSTLLLTEALEQEATERGVTVTAAEVRRRWEDAAASQFRTPAARRRFLGRQTERDLLAELRLQLLTERLHERIASDAGSTEEGKAAVDEFKRTFQKRWAERTACRDGQSATLCR